MSRHEAMRRLKGANPVSTAAVSSFVPAAQRADLLERIVRLPAQPHLQDTNGAQHNPNKSPNATPIDAPTASHTEPTRKRRPSRKTLVLLGFVAAAILTGTAYAVVHALIVGSP